MMMFYVVALALLVVCPTLIVGYPTGAPGSACRTLRPAHSGRPQEGSSPYAVTFVMPSSGGYLPSQQIDVHINSTTGALYKGFILTAKAANGSDIDGQVWQTSGRRTSYTKVICNRKAVTQSYSRPRTTISAKWRAPSGYSGPVIFTATVVESYMKYWVDLVSEPLPSAPQ